MSTSSLARSSRQSNRSIPRVLPVDWIGGGLVLGIVVATVWIVSVALADTRSNLVAEIDTHQAVLAQTDSIQAKFQEMKDRMQDQHRQLQQLTGMVPERPSESEFLAQLSDLANQTGVQLLQFEPRSSVKRDSYSEISIRCSAQAPYAALCRFLCGLQDLPRLADVTRLIIRQSQPSEDRTLLNMELEISIFHS